MTCTLRVCHVFSLLELFINVLAANSCGCWSIKKSCAFVKLLFASMLILCFCTVYCARSSFIEISNARAYINMKWFCYELHTPMSQKNCPLTDECFCNIEFFYLAASFHLWCPWFSWHWWISWFDKTNKSGKHSHKYIFRLCLSGSCFSSIGCTLKSNVYADWLTFISIKYLNFGSRWWIFIYLKVCHVYSTRIKQASKNSRIQP